MANGKHRNEHRLPRFHIIDMIWHSHNAKFYIMQNSGIELVSKMLFYIKYELLLTIIHKKKQGKKKLMSYR